MAFYPPDNYITLTLNTSTHPTGLGTGDLSVTVNEDISGLKTQGFLNFDRYTPGSREIMKWTSYDAGTKTFTVLRGQDDTKAHTHATTCTIVVSAVKAYWDALKAYVDASIVSPPSGVGTTTAAAGAFTTLATSGAVTNAAAVTSSLTTGFSYTASPTISGAFTGFRSIPTIASGSNGSEAFHGGAIVTGGTPSEVDGYYAPITVSAGTLTDFHAFKTNASVSGTLTNRYMLYDQASGGTNQYFLKLGYATGGILSGVTTHDTESDELKVNHNGTVKYIKLYT